MNAPSDSHEVITLRGAEAQVIGRRFWTVAGSVVFTLLSILVVVSFISAALDNARIGRLKSHGVPVIVTITDCVGNIGGSGSNGAGYTCYGTYRVHGARYHEVIGSKSTLSNRGSTVRAVADPNRPSTVELASAVATSSASSSAYVVPGILAILLVSLGLLLGRRYRRSRGAEPFAQH
jgi:hypothetical protein